MKVLVLSCNTGEGHNTAGRAIIENRRKKGFQADMINALELMGVRRSKLVCGVYIKMVKKIPALFGFFLQPLAFDFHSPFQIDNILRKQAVAEKAV